MQLAAAGELDGGGIAADFSTELGGVMLLPGTGGIFEIAVDGVSIWERRRDGGFPDVRALKTRVRDRIDPDRDLGHLDRTGRKTET